MKHLEKIASTTMSKIMEQIEKTSLIFISSLIKGIKNIKNLTVALDISFFLNKSIIYSTISSSSFSVLSEFPSYSSNLNSDCGSLSNKLLTSSVILQKFLFLTE